MKYLKLFIFILFLGAIPLQAQQTLTNKIGMEFEKIVPGSMIVGRMELDCPSPPDNREVPPEDKWSTEDFKRCEQLSRRYSRPGFSVTIEKPYYIGKYEVTQGQWREVMGSNPSYFQGEKVEGNSDQYPVDSVTWEQAQEFIKRLNKMDDSATYRLPSEFEWEYAARAGATKLLSWAETNEQAWINDTDKGTTHSVGQKKPNDWGLYDTLGNVWEWTEDYYNKKIFPSPVPPDTGEVHVLRGGSFISDVTNATYFFHGGGPGNGYDVGFRIVREIEAK